MDWLASFWSWVADHATVLAGTISAIATAFIAWFTVTLSRATIGMLRASTEQTRLTGDSVALATKEFVATHRPKLRMRRVKALLTDGTQVGVSFILANVGDSAAHIRSFNIDLGLNSVSDGGWSATVRPIDLRTLAPGETYVFLAMATDLTYQEKWGVANNIPGAALDFRGTVTYADDNGIERATGFWRTRDFDGRLRPKPDPEYEYED